MKELRFKMTIEVTYDEYLGLLWQLQGFRDDLGEIKANKATVKKIARFAKEFHGKWKAWRRANFKCAGAK